MKKFIGEYHQPTDWETLSNLLSASDVAAAPILISARPETVYDRNAESMIDLSKMGLDFIRQNSGKIEIGTMATLQLIVESDLLKASQPGTILSEAARRTARINLRNLAVLGGVLQNREGPGELAIGLIAVGADAVLRKGDTIRKMPLADFIRDEVVLQPGELLCAVEFPASLTGKLGLERVSRTPQDQEIIAAAVYLERNGETIQTVHVALSGGLKTCRRFASVEKLLNGARFSADLAEQAQTAASESAEPITDLRGSADYRKAMAGLLTKGAILTAWNLA